MKLDMDKHGTIELKEVYNELKLTTADGETMYINMRDSGFEFVYEGMPYEAKKGEVKPSNFNNRLEEEDLMPQTPFYDE